MSTIDELMQGKQPGEIKITSDRVYPNYFTPYFKDSRDIWHALDNKENKHIQLGQDLWHLWQEPKKKRVMYHAVFMNSDTNREFVPAPLLKDENDARCQYPDHPFIKLLTDRPIEVDE